MQGNQNASLGELFGQLTRDASTLIRQEVQLAKAELTAQAASAAKGAVLVLMAGLLAFLGLGTLVDALVIALAQHMAPWLAALIVAVGLFVVAGILVMMALPAFKNAAKGPKQTMETLKEDAQWAKDQMKPNTSHTTISK